MCTHPSTTPSDYWDDRQELPCLSNAIFLIVYLSVKIIMAFLFINFFCQDIVLRTQRLLNFTTFSPLKRNLYIYKSTGVYKKMFLQLKFSLSHNFNRETVFNARLSDFYFISILLFIFSLGIFIYLYLQLPCHRYKNYWGRICNKPENKNGKYLH